MHSHYNLTSKSLDLESSKDPPVMIRATVVYILLEFNDKDSPCGYVEFELFWLDEDLSGILILL